MRIVACILSLLLTVAYFCAIGSTAVRGASSEKRIALVIGNGAYRNTQPLTNPGNDARALASQLRRIGFDVELQLDQDRKGMERSIQHFVQRMKAVGRADLGLFYYAGHGMQVADRNYLVPVDAQLRDETDVRPETVELQWALEEVQQWSRVGVIFLDACRNNPLVNRMRSSGRSVGRGLSVVRVDAGDLVIVYATSPGEIAADGQGQNSPFTAALIEHIATPGLAVQVMLSRVVRSVVQSTGGRQRPWNNGSLQTEVYLAGAEDPQANLERAIWKSAQERQEPDGYAYYLKLFPRGPNATSAQQRLAQLTRPPEPRRELSKPEPISQSPTQPKPAAVPASESQLGPAKQSSPVNALPTPPEHSATALQVVAAQRGPRQLTLDAFSSTAEPPKRVTDTQIKVLQRLIDITNEGDPEKPDLLFRMGEYYTEQVRFYESMIQDLEDSIREAQQQNDTSKLLSLEAQKQLLNKTREDWTLGGIRKFLEVANGPRYQNYSKMDQALSYLTLLLGRVKKEDQARVFFKRMIKDYPQSPFLPHSYLAYGDYFFASNDYENSLKFYEKVLQYSENPVFGYCLYRKGWVYYYLTDFKQALATFIDAILFSTDPKRRGSRINPQLARESKKDLVRVYAQIGTADKAWPFFQKYGKEDAAMMMELLAVFFDTQSKGAEAKKVRDELARRKRSKPND